MRALDFGDRVTGRPCDDNGYLVRGAKPVTGIVTGVFPFMPKVAAIQTASGDRLTVKVTG